MIPTILETLNVHMQAASQASISGGQRGQGDDFNHQINKESLNYQQILFFSYFFGQEVEKEIAELVDRRLAEETTCHLAVGLFDTARNQRVQVKLQHSVFHRAAGRRKCGADELVQLACPTQGVTK